MRISHSSHFLVFRLVSSLPLCCYSSIYVCIYSFFPSPTLLLSLSSSSSSSPSTLLHIYLSYYSYYYYHYCKYSCKYIYICVIFFIIIKSLLSSFSVHRMVQDVFSGEIERRSYSLFLYSNKNCVVLMIVAIGFMFYYGCVRTFCFSVDRLLCSIFMMIFMFMVQLYYTYQYIIIDIDFVADRHEKCVCVIIIIISMNIYFYMLLL